MFLSSQTQSDYCDGASREGDEYAVEDVEDTKEEDSLTTDKFGFFIKQNDIPLVCSRIDNLKF